MAYIYKISNDINQKLYIGKTEFSIDKRWKEHCNDALKNHNEKRPLYLAMQKYGIEHFTIELIEETDNPEEREQFWIQYYNSYHDGYNATLGGDGKKFLNYNQIYQLWQQGLLVEDISSQLNYDRGQVGKILTELGISTQMKRKRAKQIISHPVAQIDKNNNNILAIYNSVAEAERAMSQKSRGHIGSVCVGKRLSAYGYKWKYV